MIARPRRLTFLVIATIAMAMFAGYTWSLCAANTARAETHQALVVQQAADIAEVTLPNHQEVSLAQLAPGRRVAVVAMKSDSCRVCQGFLTQLAKDTHLAKDGVLFGLTEESHRVRSLMDDHKLPFMAQKVIDLGYDLPLPYGITVLHTDIDQAQNLDGLKVGFSGSEKEPFDWVAFENARSQTKTWQLMGDMWVLPFLNVFGFVGDIDGDAPMNVILDGNGLLEQKGVDCSRPGNLVLCRFLQDQEIDLPIFATFSGKNYGVGFNLAGGWKGFFFTLPVSFSWTNMDTTDVEGGAVISASPRLGRLVKLGDNGNLGLYLGASYLDSNLTAHGSLAIPETDVTIDYDIDQSNQDKWAGILGANWAINGHWSLTVEYNGFFGSRESWIGGVAYRF